MRPQVDYGKDDKWNAWREEALRRLLVHHEKPQTSVASVSTPWITPLQLPTQVDAYIPASWSHLGANAKVPMSPVFLGTKFDTDEIFGPCTKTMGLEGDLWGLGTVRPVNWME
jgi:hypothetical protein